MMTETERAEARRQARERFDREYGAEAAAMHGAREPSTSRDTFGIEQAARRTGRPDLYGIEQKCEREWASSASIRDEFGGRYESYLAYKKAQARGLIKIFGGRRRDA